MLTVFIIIVVSALSFVAGYIARVLIVNMSEPELEIEYG